MSKVRTAIIAGGGTGGNLYPALAVANELMKMDPSLKIHFVGSSRGLETKIVPRAGFPLHLISIGGLARSGILQKIKTAALIPVSLLQSLLLILKLRPQFVLGVGGYASGPLLLMASLTGRRTYLFEPNAYPGLTNRLLAPFVKTAFVVFDEALPKLKSSNGIRAGLPVRESIKPRASEAHEKLRVLIFGGSQGARGINKVVAEAVQAGGDWLSRVEIVHQTGRHDIDEMKRVYKPTDPVQVFEYLDDIQNNYAWADVVICRAGASTIAELAACRKAAVFVPLATATDNHQQKNAEAVVHENAGRMVLQKDFTASSLKTLIEEYQRDRSQLRIFEERIQKFDSPGAAHKMAQKLLETT